MPVVRRTAAPFKSGFVVIDCHCVQLNSSHERRFLQRNPAFLPCIAQHDGVGVDAVAHHHGGQSVGIESAHPIFTDDGGDAVHTILRGVNPIGVFDERRCGRAVRVKRDMGATRAHAQRGFFVGGDDRVAADDHIRARHAHTGGANFVLVVGNQDMAPSRASFLRQTTSVLRDDAFTLNVGGIAE